MYKKILLPCLLVTFCIIPIKAKIPGYLTSHIAAALHTFFLNKRHYCRSSRKHINIDSWVIVKTKSTTFNKD